MNSNVSTNPRGLSGIQVLRGVAAMSVVLHHTLEESHAGRAGPMNPEWLITLGAAGVDIFFVISGFIMLYVSFDMAGNAQSPKVFLIRRIIRIFPLYWFCIAIIIALRSGGLFSSVDISPKSILLAVTLLPGHSLVYVAWTLTFELYFYIIFAATLFFRSRAISVLGGTACIVVALFIALALPESTARTFLTNPLALEFCFGLTVAWLYIRRGRFKYCGTMIAVGAIAMLLATIMIEHPTTGGLPSTPRTFAWGIPAAIIVAAAASLKVPGGPCGRAAILIGDASYSIYLSHIFVMIVYARLLKTTSLGNIHQAGVIPLVVVVAAGVGIVLHKTIERRMIAFSQRMTRPSPEKSASYPM